MNNEGPVFHTPTGMYFPWNETRPQKMYDGLQKYVSDLDFLLRSVKNKKATKRVCIQAGGHIGVWPLRLAPHFAEVITFEPDPPVFQALKMNVEGKNVRAIEGALGERASRATLSWYSARTAVSTMTEVKDEGDCRSEVAVYAIDDFDVHVAAIVLDIEGYEPWALRGAQRTIEKYHPLIVCEMLAKSAQAITDTLAGMGYAPVYNPVNPKCRDTLFAFGGAV